MIITEILARNARVFGDKVALVEREPAKNKRMEMTWQQFDNLANGVANYLISQKIDKGDKVVHLMMNCIEWLPIYFGILRSGAIAAPLNFRFSAQDIRTCCHIAQPKAFIFGEEFIDRVSKIKSDLDSDVKTYIFAGPKEKCPEFATHYDDIVERHDFAVPDIPIELYDDAGLYFTSGTTGTPKGVLLTHRNLEFACYAENRHHNQTHDDNFLCIPPLYHTGAKMHWFGNFIVGAKAVILKGVSPKWILEAVSEEKATVVWLLVPWAHDILVDIENKVIDLNDYELDQWRLMHIGAQPVPPVLIKRWKEIFPHHQYDTNYGLTEACGPGSVHLGTENIHKVGAIGKPGFDWECRIVDFDLNPVEECQTGELLLRGPGIMKEYYKNPEATEMALKDGWLLTGDIVYQDSDGFIWLVDRKKDVIITGGENIYPVEIEHFLMENENILDAAAIGISDERLGEIVGVIITTKPNRSLTEEDVKAFCQALPKYKRPRRIFFDQVPRNATGKIEKPKLREQYANRPPLVNTCKKAG